MPEFLVIRKRKFEALKNLYDEKQLELAVFQKSVQFIIDEIQKKINEYSRTETKLKEYISKLRNENKPAVPMRPKQRSEVEQFLTELLTEIEKEPQLEDKKELEEFLSELLNASVQSPTIITTIESKGVVGVSPTQYQKAKADRIAELDSILQQKIDNVELTDEDVKNYDSSELSEKFLKKLLNLKKKLFKKALLKTERKDRIKNDIMFLKQVKYNNSVKDKTKKYQNIPPFYVKFFNQIQEEKANIRIAKKKELADKLEAYTNTPEGKRSLEIEAQAIELKKQEKIKRQQLIDAEEEAFRNSLLSENIPVVSQERVQEQAAERQRFLDMLERLDNIPLVLEREYDYE